MPFAFYLLKNTSESKAGMSKEEIKQVRRRMTAEENIERLFEDIFSRSSRHYETVSLLGWKPPADWYAQTATPADLWPDLDVAGKTRNGSTAADVGVEVSETPTQIRIVVRLPFVLRETISIAIQQKILTLSGEQALPEDETEPPNGANDASHRFFRRTFTLPSRIGRGAVKARWIGLHRLLILIAT